MNMKNKRLGKRDPNGGNRKGNRFANHSLSEIRHDEENLVETSKRAPRNVSSRGMNGSIHQSGPPTKPDRVQVIQHCGILQKQPFGPTNQSTRWAKRFFIVKDGFLLYYNDNEKKEYDKSQVMNLHPKGVLPLGGCCVEESSDPTHPFCIQIKSVDTQNSFLLSADNDIVRRKWVDVLQQASRITLRNAKLGDAMIQQLEKQGLEMAEEKQKYFDKYKVETQQSEAHKIRAQELEKMNQELERRRLQLENSVFDMKKEYDEMQKQLQETAAAARNVEETKLKLQDQTMQLQKNLEELELEKSQIVDDFKRQQVESLELSKEKENLSEKTQQLNAKLNDIELKMKKVSAEKSLAELSFKEQELKSRQLLEDNMNIGQYAQQLNESLKALNDQKNATEVELREEVTARMEAEKRLHEAEESLGRLEAALDRQQQLLQQRTVEKDADDAMTQMIGDVNTLKKFFENVTFEAKIDARKGLMIKQSIEAKKAVVRRTRTVLLDNLHLDFTQPPPTNPNIARQFAPLTSFLSMDPDSEGTPSSPSSTIDPFQRKAERCLQTPNSRHSAFALLQSIDLQDLTKEQDV